MHVALLRVWVVREGMPVVRRDRREAGAERRVGGPLRAAPAALRDTRLARPESVDRVVPAACRVDLLQLGSNLARPDPPPTPTARGQRCHRPAYLDDVDWVERRQTGAPVENGRRQAIDDAH